ncbi:hypothetical protein IAT40_001787 [Kwoniella sp. CBS 6097]
MSSPYAGSQGEETDKKRPTHLQPPATIISPPSPTDTKDSHSPTFTFPPRPPSPENDNGRQVDTTDEHVEYDSPEEEDDASAGPSGAGGSGQGQDRQGSDTPPSNSRTRMDRYRHTKPRGPNDSLGTPSSSQIATYMSESPRRDSSLQLPDTPDPSASSTRPPSPSSPRYRPKGLHHRRTSSTHRVRETTDGQQRNTEDGQRMINQYRIGKSLGKGAYAKVELAMDVGTGIEYAIKEFSKSRLHYQSLQEKHRQNNRNRMRRSQQPPGMPSGTAIQQAGEQALEAGGNRPWGGTKTIEEDPLGLIRREVAVMKKLDNSLLVHLYEAISVPTADALFLVLEYMPGGTLMEVQVGQDDTEAKSPFSLWQTREYFRQLCLGLEYLHANEVVHRDIKPDNVLLSADRQLVKLCDFGVSEMFTNSGDDRIKKSGGSPAFLSPESFTAHQQELHGKAVDIWALGVTLYCMLTGKLPFNVPNPMELFTAVREKKPNIPDDWEDTLKDLMTRMLEKDPQKRIIMSDIRIHAWVTEQGQEPMIETDENLFEVGKQVEEPTQEELKNAIGSLRGIFTVIRAVQKMRRLRLNRQSISHGHGHGHGQAPSSPGSTNISLASGSMDSYLSHDPDGNGGGGGGTGTSATSVSDDTEDPKYRDIAGDPVMSPKKMSYAENKDTLAGKLEKLAPLDTDTASQSAKSDDGQREGEGDEGGNGYEDEEEDGENIILVDSPVSSDDEVQKTPVRGTSR